MAAVEKEIDRVTAAKAAAELLTLSGIHASVAENAIQCVAEGTCKSLDSIQDMQDGTMNLSRRKQIN